jgi:hypothetical protein
MIRRSSRRLVRVALSVAAGLLLLPAGPSAEQTGLPTAREIVDRSLKAIGGAEAFKAVKSLRARGTLSIPAQGMSGDLEMMAARPNKLLTRAKIAGMGQLEEAYDGKIAWSLDPVNGPSLVIGKALSERADEAWFDSPLHAEGYVRLMTVAGKETFDKRPAYRVKITLMSGAELSELFDVETGFQIGFEASRETPFGTVPTRSIFRDYKQFGTLMYPTSISQSVLGIEQVVTFTSYEFNLVPANTFDVPPVIKALIK